MYYVYVLKSLKDHSLYIGYTNDIDRRLLEHNSGQSVYTKSRCPWALVYYEAFSNLDDAKKREGSLKYFGKAYGQLKGRIKRSLNSLE
jgi:putative endonuclease